MILRAEIMSFTLRSAGNVLEAKFPRRSHDNRKIKVGFLNAHFGPQTETYTSLPTLNLDRDKFEIHLFALQKGTGPLITHCERISDSFTELPAALNEQVAMIRAARLDIILIGTNVTAVTNQICLLALHKLAPIQIATSSSPMTTGMKTMDGYLSGTVRGFDAYSQHYTEPLILVDTAISCLEFTLDPKPAVITPTRQDLGIADDAVLFVSGANFHKIIPELRETWVKILQRVPGSSLLLHPFNPNWSNQYPTRQFSHQFKAVLAEYGIDPKRLLISTNTLPTRSDVRAMMALGDVYLDSYPLSGSVSLVDPLQAGVPPVIWHGSTLRSLMAASMLCDLELQELITNNEADYIDLAVRLAGDPARRQRLRADIRTKMARSPRFFACAECGREVSAALEALVVQPEVELMTANA
jgi:predicted O-linked N-acetylglucosamine transferase (SPINDLY family)